MHAFEERLSQVMSGLATPQDIIIVAVSGGADSVALLLGLHRLGFTLVAAHCNFHLRGDESDADESFVRDLCLRLNTPVCSTDFDTRTYASAQSISIEMAARELRYEWFAYLLNEYRTNIIAVAHHRDDDIETTLLNLSMGTGIRGLSGMPLRRKDGIIRPLLSSSRKEIESYLKELGQAYCVDSTNADTAYKRNYIRHQLLPAFRRLNPSAEKAISRTTQHLKGIELVLADYIEELKRRISTNRGLLIAPIAVSSSPETILFELLRPYGFGRHIVQDIARGLLRPSGTIYYSPSHRLIIGQEYLDISSISDTVSTLPVIEIDTIADYQVIDLPDRSSAPEHKHLLIERVARSSLCSLKTPSHTALFDADRITSLTLRPRKEHDRIHPFGLNGSKTIARYGIDRKLTHTERTQLYILCTQDQPIWILGRAADRLFGVDSSSTQILRCTLLP